MYIAAGAGVGKEFPITCMVYMHMCIVKNLFIMVLGLPIPIVAISAGIRFEDYGNGTV